MPEDSKAFIKAMFGTIGVIVSCIIFLFVGIFNELWLNWILGMDGLCLLIISMILFIEGWYKMGQYSIKND